MKRILILACVSLSLSKCGFIGTEYVSPSLQRKTSQSNEIPDSTAAPLASTEASTVSGNEMDLEANPFANKANIPVRTELIDERQINDIQMLLALRDIIRVDEYLRNLNKQLGERIYGD